MPDSDKILTTTVLALPRFRPNKKEAISKNVVNLAEQLSNRQHTIMTLTPVEFATQSTLEQCTYRTHSQYSSLVEALKNLHTTCRLLNRWVQSGKTHNISLHIASPIEALCARLWLNRHARQNTRLSVWQSWMTWAEIKTRHRFYLAHVTRYIHLLLFNSCLSAFLYRWALPTFNGVIVHSQHQQDQLQALGIKQVNKINNGVFTADISPRPRVYQPGIDKKDRPLRLVYIGHAKPSKGVDVLLEITARLKQRNRVPFVLSLCLSGFGHHQPLQDQITRLSLSDVVDYKYDIDVHTEMTQSDLLILPLRTCIGTSMQPNLIVEALSLGLPVAIPSFTELDEIINFGNNAIEIDRDNHDVSAHNIESAWLNGTLDQLSVNQRKQFLAGYTLEQFVDGYEQLLGLNHHSSQPPQQGSI